MGWSVVVLCWPELGVPDRHVLDKLLIVVVVLLLPYFSFFYFFCWKLVVSISLLSDMGFHSLGYCQVFNFKGRGVVSVFSVCWWRCC